MPNNDLETNKKNAHSSACQTRYCVERASLYTVTLLKLFIEIVPGYFRVAKVYFGSTGQDVRGFGPHSPRKVAKWKIPPREKKVG